jgi:hypothetical protein
MIETAEPSSVYEKCATTFVEHLMSIEVTPPLETTTGLQVPVVEVSARRLAEGSRVDVEMNREITESRASERVRMCQYSLAYLLHRISVFGWPLLVTMTGLQSPVVPKEGPSLNFAPKPMLSA